MLYTQEQKDLDALAEAVLKCDAKTLRRVVSILLKAFAAFDTYESHGGATFDAFRGELTAKLREE